MKTFKQVVENKYKKKVEELVHLKKLDLSYTQISDLSGLENLINLEELYLYNNEISNLKPLEKLVKLEALYLSYNKITNLKPLENLVNLNTLHLNSNPIKNSKSSFVNPHTSRIVYFNKKNNLYSCGCFCNATAEEFKEICMERNFKQIIKHFNL